MNNKTIIGFIQKTVKTYIQENEIKNDKLTVYHGTKPKFVNDIRQNGLVNSNGYNQGWYMVSTDFESALYHAYSDNGFVYVFEFEIPISDNDRWLGYPYLWKGSERDGNSTWFTLMQKLPKKFIKRVHKISYEDWLNQKYKGF